ncbi:MAG: 5-formyltetrahydrofolate cyclo-ligase, partial [Muribaculaceae bacterium]|nr:5-formyltetrahydrofolate cyclo-ligase [Muribaculaceae bacterium]
KKAYDMKKEDIRIRIRSQKSILSDEAKLQAARAAFEILARHASFMMDEHILLYHSLPDELSSRSFIEKWAGRKHFYLPRVNGVNLEILPYDRSTLSLGAFHIEEPQGNETADINDIELIIVPGVAYDREGNRVGRGKGYYDRLLATSKATKIGMAYDFQLVDEIDAEPHDIKVDFVITDKGSITIKHRKRHK